MKIGRKIATTIEVLITKGKTIDVVPNFTIKP